MIITKIMLLLLINRTKACYSDCTYIGATKDSAEWETEEYCFFRASLDCNQELAAEKYGYTEMSAELS